jgi:hypothetical protein
VKQRFALHTKLYQEARVALVGPDAPVAAMSAGLRPIFPSTDHLHHLPYVPSRATAIDVESLPFACIRIDYPEIVPSPER